MARTSDELTGPDPAGDQERSTFLSIGEVLERTRRYAERAQDVLLQRLREAGLDERTRMFVDTVEQQRAELEAAIDRCVRRAPGTVLDVRAQYTVELWDREPSPPHAHSVEEATRWILELDERLIRTYRDLAESSESDDVREFLETLIELVRGHDRTLSTESHTVRDL